MLLEQTGNWKKASLFSEVLNFALTKAGKDSMFFIYPIKFVIKDRERLSNCRHFEALPLEELDARLRGERNLVPRSHSVTGNVRSVKVQQYTIFHWPLKKGCGNAIYAPIGLFRGVMKVWFSQAHVLF